jgi:hypothetical protein
MGKAVSTFVSKFAETEIAILKRRQAVKELFCMIKKIDLILIAGGVFEGIFFLWMRSSGISLYMQWHKLRIKGSMFRRS